MRSTSAAFSPDGARVVTASEDKTARVWDAATGAPIGKPLQHEGEVYRAAFSPDGARVVTVSEDSTARVWTPRRSRPTSSRPHARCLRDHDTADLSARYGIDVKDPIWRRKNRRPTPRA